MDMILIAGAFVALTLIAVVAPQPKPKRVRARAHIDRVDARRVGANRADRG